LTRFWASIAPLELLVVIENALQVQGIRAKRAIDGPNGELRCRIGALDHRRVPFKGWVIVEPFSTADGGVRSFCIMQRDEVKVIFYLCLMLTYWRCETHRAIPYRGGECSGLLYNHNNLPNTSSAGGSEDHEFTLDIMI